MSLHLTRRAPGWDGNITGDNTVTLKLPMGLTYHRVYTEYTFADSVPADLALADAVGFIRLIANGKPIWQILASELDTNNQFESRAAAGTAAGGILTLDFDRYNLRSRLMEEFTSLGTGAQNDPTPLTTLHIEMDLKTAVASGTLKSRIEQSRRKNLGLFKKLRRYVETFTSSGQFEIDTFPKGDLINKVSFFQSANEIDNVRLEKDDYIMFDRSNALNERIQLDGVRTPQALLYVQDTTELGNGLEQIITKDANDLRWFLDLSGAMTITSVVEYLGALEN